MTPSGLRPNGLDRTAPAAAKPTAAGFSEKVKQVRKFILTALGQLEKIAFLTLPSMKEMRNRSDRIKSSYDVQIPQRQESIL